MELAALLVGRGGNLHFDRRKVDHLWSVRMDIAELSSKILGQIHIFSADSIENWAENSAISFAELPGDSATVSRSCWSVERGYQTSMSEADGVALPGGLLTPAWTETVVSLAVLGSTLKSSGATSAIFPATA